MGQRRVPDRLESSLSGHRQRLQHLGKRESAIAASAFFLLATAGIGTLLAHIRVAALGAVILVAIMGAGALFAVSRRVRARIERERARVAGMEIVSTAFVPLVIASGERERGAARPVVVVPGLRSDTAQEARRARLASVAAIAGWALGAAAIVATGVVGSTFAHRRGEPARWTFLEERGVVESGLAPAASAHEAWRIEEHAPATGGRALVKQAEVASPHPAIIVATAKPYARDARVVTRCMVAGVEAEPAACGVVVRFVDERNHRLVRIDVASRAVEVVAVDDGVARVLARAPVPVAASIWQEVAVEARGAAFAVSVNGRHVLRAFDRNKGARGAAGLWAPPGGTVYFDELTVEPASGLFARQS